jgi:hypothetical protein
LPGPVAGAGGVGPVPGRGGASRPTGRAPAVHPGRRAQGRARRLGRRRAPPGAGVGGGRAERRPAPDGAERGLGPITEPVHQAVTDAVGKAAAGTLAGRVRAATLDAVGQASGEVPRRALHPLYVSTDESVRAWTRQAEFTLVTQAMYARWCWSHGGWRLDWPAYFSFLRQVCGLELPGDLWARGRPGPGRGRRRLVVAAPAVRHGVRAPGRAAPGVGRPRRRPPAPTPRRTGDPVA